ncbi:MAG: hypothetical protein M3680_12755 [Myxococcota bacterium]|nr:hypothetical protein [Myxococcota bacterium]
MRRFAIATLFLLAGCDLYFGGGDDAPCALGSKEDGLAPAYEHRNPHTGQCEQFGGGGCDYRCGPCPAYDTSSGADIAQPDWGSCYSQCEALDENSCLVTSGCRAAYTEFQNDDRVPEFRGCWATAPSGPVQGGGCVGLDAHACSRHDDCSAYYIEPNWSTARLSPPLTSEFSRCAPENVGAACTGNQDCNPGERCTAGQEECSTNPNCDPTGACTDECWGHCVPSSTCTTVMCGPNSHCEETCNGTTCTPTCVPDVSGCLAATCAPGYECVETCTGTTGNCQISCVPDTACEALPTQLACSTRSDCTEVFLGDDCTCYPGYCECNVLTYDRCETK